MKCPPQLPAPAGEVHSYRHSLRRPNGLAACLGIAVFFTLVHADRAAAQDSVGAARELLQEGRPAEAVALLREVVLADPTPDAYLYLGIALANISQSAEALEILSDGSVSYPEDSRFHDEIAGVHLSNRDTDLAVVSLERAIELNPADTYAADLLASIRLSEGNVRDALAMWNSIGQPEIDEISQNFAPGLLDRTVPQALAFDSGDMLRYGQWKTTEARLFGSRLYSNVGIELEPSPAGERFNAIVRTSAHRNTRNDVLIDLVRGLPTETTYFDLWDIGHSGLSWRSSFRWDKDRRQLSGQLFIPLPLPTLPVLELKDTWRQERWNLERPIREVFQSDELFEYKVNLISLSLETTPHYRLAFHGGVEYRNRDVTGTIGALGMDGRNSGTFSVGTIIRPVDGRYSSQIRIDGFIARQKLLGDFDFSGGTAKLMNRFVLRTASQTFLDISASGGTLRGSPPIDHYYILGLSSLTDHPLRAHVADDAGRYGRAPMGTDFVLFNSDLEHRVATVPLFNAASIPYIYIKLMGFFDTGKTFDRQRVFRQDEWFRDTGLGVKFETPTSAFTVLYGRDLTGHENSFYAYVEPNLW